MRESLMSRRFIEDVWQPLLSKRACRTGSTTPRATPSPRACWRAAVNQLDQYRTV
jgi:hypothetical protein